MHAYILAGGQSRRFGEDKTLYPINGKPLIFHIYERVSKYFPTFVVAKDTKKYKNLGIENLITDEFEKIQTPLVGIYTGLKHSPFELNLFLSADLPFICEQFLEFVKNYEYPKGFKGFVPLKGEKYHFTAAVYSKELLPLLEEAIKKGKLPMKQFLKEFLIWDRLENIPKECFFNLNRKEDLKTLGKLKVI